MKRTETFVFEFDDQEIFSDFFEKYWKNPPTGIKPLSCSIGNIIQEKDDLEEELYHRGIERDLLN